MKNITKAILQVTKEVKNIEKTMSVGAGGSSYKAVSDTIVRNALRPEMIKAGLVIVPIDVQPTIKIDRWEENSRVKQSILTEVKTKYMLVHSESGESLEIAGYGHGVDSQDKGAGKATTYALKNALLDLFLLTKGEDTDETHSDDYSVPPIKMPQKTIRYDEI